MLIACWWAFLPPPQTRLDEAARRRDAVHSELTQSLAKLGGGGGVGGGGLRSCKSSMSAAGPDLDPCPAGEEAVVAEAPVYAVADTSLVRATSSAASAASEVEHVVAAIAHGPPRSPAAVCRTGSPQLPREPG